MMNVIDTLVIDRTEADVEAVKNLQRKILTEGLSSLTQEEYDTWFGGMRGAYHHIVLNRVGEAVNFLRHELAGFQITVNVTGKTDWKPTDTPTPAQMTTYLQNLDKLKAALPLRTVETPDTMRWLTIEKMNAIERILYDLGWKIRHIQNTWCMCGEAGCGEW